jgi:P-type Ca2+ transporter type 2C
MTEPVDLFVAHNRVPGRLRLRAAALKRQPELGSRLERALHARSGVHGVQINPISGSILVRFDLQRVTTERLLQWTAQSLRDLVPSIDGAPPPGSRGAAAEPTDPLPRPPLPSSARRRGRPGQTAKASPDRPAPALAAAQHWAAQSVSEVFNEVGSSPAGLAPAAAARRRARDGANRLPELDRRSSAQILKDQLISVPTLMLVGAVGLSVATGGLVDAAVIAAVLALNGTIGFGTERYAESAIRALQRLGSPRATVLRDGHTQNIPGADVVVGDVARLRPGDVVPADARVIESHALAVEEAPLTGESVPVAKIAEPIPPPSSIADCRNLVFMGTAVATGHGRALVTATGPKTQIGRINALVGGEVAPRTRMQEGLDDLARRLGVGTFAVCGGMFGLGLALGLPALGMLQTAVALAISAVPEGLPAVATTALAIGMARMLRRQVVIRKLPAVEALGGVTVLCVDKTGTLTLNRMQVIEVRVDGQSRPFHPAQEWQIGRVPPATPPPLPGMPETLRRLLEVGALCNEADLEIGSKGLRIRGSSTEGALLLAAQNAGIDTAALREANSLLDIRHRETGNPMMATLHETESGRFRLCVKGAPGTVLGVCSHGLIEGRRVRLTAPLRRQILTANEDMAARGLRVLGFAEAERAAGELAVGRRLSAVGEVEDSLGRTDSRQPTADGLPTDGLPTDGRQPMADGLVDLTWLGLTGMEDPLRPGVAESIARCRQAGIRTVILTGDHPATAAAVARALDISTDSDEHVAEASALIGLPPAQLREMVARIDVYARVSPEDKLRIVRALQANGEVVAMTGDGINDGPAMKAADVGIAMGGQGTEVAKEIADMVLLEDDFDQMAAAIEQGRTIYGNIRRALRYLVASNLSEVVLVGAALLTRMPIPFTALQMLWMNLISDVFPALALTLEPPPPEIMHQLPRPPEEPLIPREEWRGVMRDSLALATSTMVAYRSATRRHGVGLTAQTVAFTTGALGEILYALACGSPLGRAADTGSAGQPPGAPPARSLFRPPGLLLPTVAATAALQVMTLFAPPLRGLLQLTPLDRTDWLTVLAGALLPVLLATRQRHVPALPAPGPSSATARQAVALTGS